MTERDFTPIPQTPPIPSVENEAYAQWLNLFHHVLCETLDAMEQEPSPAPIKHHWQLFLHYLQLKKPKLAGCLEQLQSNHLIIPHDKIADS